MKPEENAAYAWHGNRAECLLRIVERNQCAGHAGNDAMIDAAAAHATACTIIRTNANKLPETAWQRNELVVPVTCPAEHVACRKLDAE